MEALDIRDLVEGRNDWCNIPDVIRASLKILHDEILRQKSETSHRLDTVYQRLEQSDSNHTSVKTELRMLSVNSHAESVE